MNELICEVDQTLTPSQLEFVTASLSSSFGVETVQLNEMSLTINFAREDLRAELQKSTRRLLFIAKNINKDLVFEHKVTPRYQDDPQRALEAVQDVIPVHPGFFTLQGDFLRVFHALNATVKGFAHDLNAVEQEYPAVWPVRLFKKIDYFHEFPQQVILCAPVKEDFASRDAFATRYAKNRSFESVQMDELMADAEYGLESAVCDCCYYSLEGQKNLLDSYYTCYNKVFRNERSASGGLDRLTNFSVRDIMFVGTEDFVLECRQTLIEILTGFISRLQLYAKIETANDPFFANDSAMKSVFQNSHRLKYELLAWIPHLNREIAVGSVNFHMDFFGNAFDISATNGKPAFSGCIGVGMERMTYALFCQHGDRLADWPEDVRKYLRLNGTE